MPDAARPSGQGPDFLIIGAQRSGTTWLSQALRRHPEVWMPPVKELHYFDRSTDYPSPNFLAETGPWRRFFGSSEWSAGNRLQFVRCLGGDLLRLDRRGVGWSLRFHFGRCSDRWYASLFDGRPEKTVGEATPAYAILDREDVARVRKLFPHLKLIFVLRDPAERAWSHLRLHYRARRLRDLTVDQMREFLMSPVQRRRGDYLGTLDRWGAAFPREQLGVFFFDDLRARPREFLAEVCDFLGVEAHPHPGPLKRVNAARELEPPAEIRRSLYELYLDPMQELAGRLGRPVDAWVERARRYLDAHA